MSHESERKRIKITPEELEKLSKDEVIRCWQLQEEFLNNLESSKPSESESLKECEERLKQHHIDASRRESVLVMRLTQKEHEMQEYLAQIQELKQNQVPSTAQLKTTLVDPAVNFLFDKMQKELESTRTKLEETQNELSAWKFTPDSNNGKRLLMKCRMLYQENEELGKMVAIGRIAKIEGDLALQKQFSEEMKISQEELEDFIYQLEEDEEGLQGTIYLLQQQLREANQQVSQLKEANQNLQNQVNKFQQNGPLTIIDVPTVIKLSHPPNKEEFRTEKQSPHSNSSSEPKGRGRTKASKSTAASKLEEKKNNGSVVTEPNLISNRTATVMKSDPVSNSTSKTTHSSRSNKRRSPCQPSRPIEIILDDSPIKPPPSKKFHSAAVSLKDAGNVTDPEALAAVTLANLWAGNHVTNGSDG